ncbi:MAG: hypothetical protein ABGZ49_13795 [Akkermansiaceae bacterium]|mgnify:CR=1 FL=1|jgi:hypothetical protein|nr:hypothetical protein [Roseibacillus sp.]
MDLFRLTLSTLIARKMWVVVLLAAIFTPIVFPYFTPHETATKLLEPARAQTAWTVTWIIGILWTLSQAARFGDSNSRTGIGAYFRSQGCGPIRQIFGMWSAIMLFLLPVVAIAIGMCVLFAMPSDATEASMWVNTNLQFAALFLLTIGPLALLGIGVASRFGALIGYVLPTALCVYGLYGVGYLGMTIKLPGHNPVLEWVYALSPQYHLANLTPRLIFKMGHLEMGAFLGIVGYFTALTLVIGSFATLMFRTDPLRN